MVENIPQVNYMDTSQWPKDMHLGYAKNVVRRIDEEWTEVYHFFFIVQSLNLTKPKQIYSERYGHL